MKIWQMYVAAVVADILGAVVWYNTYLTKFDPTSRISKSSFASHVFWHVFVYMVVSLVAFVIFSLVHFRKREIKSDTVSVREVLWSGILAYVTPKVMYFLYMFILAMWLGANGFRM